MLKPKYSLIQLFNFEDSKDTILLGKNMINVGFKIRVGSKIVFNYILPFPFCARRFYSLALLLDLHFFWFPIFCAINEIFLRDAFEMCQRFSTFILVCIIKWNIEISLIESHACRLCHLFRYYPYIGRTISLKLFYWIMYFSHEQKSKITRLSYFYNIFRCNPQYARKCPANDWTVRVVHWQLNARKERYGDYTEYVIARAWHMLSIR